MFKKSLIIIGIVGLTILIGFYWGAKIDKQTQPQPQQGILDLRDWDFSHQSIINLNGEWEFYWKQLVSCEDFSYNIKPDAYIKVPSYWRGYQVKGESLSGMGYATYRLKVKTGQAGQRLGLKIQPFSPAYIVNIKWN